MSAASFVNAHITENHDEYQAYCKSLYKGRYLYHDLFQEFYVYIQSLPESRLLKYNGEGKLKCICKLIIKRMYLRRGRKVAGGETNPLNETCTGRETPPDFDLQRTSAI